MRKITKWLLLFLLLATFAGCLVACNNGDMLDGMYKVQFKFNGGSLSTDTSTVNDASTFGYAYEEKGVLILDPVKKYSHAGTTDAISRDKYVFTGWYKDVGCTVKWDFDKDTLQDDLLILYAGWELAINHTYSVRYWDESSAKEVILGIYKLSDSDISAGAKFNDRRNYANLRKGYTSLGEYYKDKECTQPWDYDYTHPGGDSDLDVPVYAKYLQGEYILVRNYQNLYDAINGDGNLRGNVYIMNDFDCGGEELQIQTLNYEFNGNGKIISNITVNPFGAFSLCMIHTIGDKGQMHDVTFNNVKYVISENSMPTMEIAVLAQGTTQKQLQLTNVHINGTVVNNSTNNYDLSGLFEGNGCWLINGNDKVVLSNSSYGITLETKE